MLYSIKTLNGIAHLTKTWKENKDYFFEWCKENGDKRWQGEEEGFVEHMYAEFINTAQPITCRLYSLDEPNLKLVIRYCNEVASSGCKEIVIEDSRAFEKKTEKLLYRKCDGTTFEKKREYWEEI